ncbi:NADH:ubiquinone oxidoreductase subunit 5 [Zymobacter palmae]|uniref:NADH:ubiquinone oxidoreductase subunit 5 n=1 Tax=Zymobacter palmae TaxID=33074 RepID=A0A348HE54_9GAMM|nr:NADH:ubiquinone oxidoreductase subunit 5 [Zymobacter palmae]
MNFMKKALCSPHGKASHALTTCGQPQRWPHVVKVPLVLIHLP